MHTQAICLVCLGVRTQLVATKSSGCFSKPASRQVWKNNTHLFAERSREGLLVSEGAVHPAADTPLGFAPKYVDFSSG